jgi:hypothetical protein
MAEEEFAFTWGFGLLDFFRSEDGSLASKHGFEY